MLIFCGGLLPEKGEKRMLLNLLFFAACALIFYILGYLSKSDQINKNITSLISHYNDELYLKNVEIGRLERKIHDLKQTKDS